MHTRALHCPDPQEQPWHGIPEFQVPCRASPAKGNCCPSAQSWRCWAAVAAPRCLFVGMVVPLPWVFWGVIPGKSHHWRWCWRSCCGCGQCVQPSCVPMSWACSSCSVPSGTFPGPCRAPNAQQCLSFLLKVTGTFCSTSIPSESFCSTEIRGKDVRGLAASRPEWNLSWVSWNWWLI